jgi:hypothetical protein
MLYMSGKDCQLTDIPTWNPVVDSSTENEWASAALEAVNKTYTTPTELDASGHLLHNLVWGIFSDPERVDAVLGVWLGNCRGFVDMGECMLQMMDMIYNNPVQIELDGTGAVRFFKCSRCALHTSFFTEAERTVISAIRKRRKVYFLTEKGAGDVGSARLQQRRGNFGRSSFSAAAAMATPCSLSTCIFNDEIAVGINRDRICARLFATILLDRRGDDREHVSPALGPCLSILTQTLHRFQIKHWQEHAFEQTADVLRYGVVSIVECTWVWAIDYLPGNYYKAIKKYASDI